MPRTARASRAGWCYHALNRGNRRAEAFHSERDYADFAQLLRQACARVPMRLLAYCLMPNHFHLVLWPSGDGDLGRWMQWLLTTHVRRYHARYHSSGRARYHRQRGHSRFHLASGRAGPRSPASELCP